jgi:hypothetical protein
MSQLTAEGLEEYALGLALKGVGPRSINHDMDAVKRSYTVYSCGGFNTPPFRAL